MFHFDGGLKLTKAALAIDFRRGQRRAFISHAHLDHMARHHFALCTPATARLYHLRLGVRDVRLLPFRETVEWGGLRLTTFPAGHCLGSAMLLAEDEGRTLLYTGDFKLAPSATAQRAELPSADILVIESTFGDPRYRLPPRDEVLAQFFQRIAEVLQRGATPVVEAYVLGKAQEVTRLLTDEGYLVAQHPKIHRVSQVYEQCGVRLGNYRRLDGRHRAGQIIIVPPGWGHRIELAEIRRTESFAMTGWAARTDTSRRLNVDHTFPLSDHADYDQLVEAVRRVNPRVVYTTHGPPGFDQHLRDLGYDARPLDGAGTRTQSLRT
jgi:Cft2 family RNA processing exonuclease